MFAPTEAPEKVQDGNPVDNPAEQQDREAQEKAAEEARRAAERARKEAEKKAKEEAREATKPTDRNLDDIMARSAGTTSLTQRSRGRTRGGGDEEKAPAKDNKSTEQDKAKKVYDELVIANFKKTILDNEQGKKIADALGGIDNLDNKALEDLRSIVSRAKGSQEVEQALDKVAELAENGISEKAQKEGGYKTQEILKNLINHLANPGRDYNIGGRDNCPAGGALGSLLKEKPEEYAKQVIDLFTSEDGTVTKTVGTGANKREVTITLNLNALKNVATASELAGGMKPADMLEVSMQASYMDAAAKMAWGTYLKSEKGQQWLRDNPDKANELPRYNPEIDKIVYPDGSKWGGLNREEDHAIEIITHGGADRLDLHSFVQNAEVRELFNQKPLTRDALNKVKQELEAKEGTEDLVKFIKMIDKAIEKGEEGDIQTFSVAMFYRSGHLEDEGSLHKVYMSVHDTGPEEGLQVTFHNTWGATDPEFDAGPYTGATKTGPNTYKSSLADMIMHSRLDHVFDTVTEEGLSITEVEPDPARDMNIWERFYPEDMIWHGERIGLPWSLRNGEKHITASNPKGYIKRETVVEPNKSDSKSAGTTEELSDNIGNANLSARQIEVNRRAAEGMKKASEAANQVGSASTRDPKTQHNRTRESGESAEIVNLISRVAPKLNQNAPNGGSMMF